jgi:hypothetical protein
MIKNKLQIVLILSVLVLITLACGFSASTANIKNAYMALDEQGTRTTTLYPQDSEFYCIVELANAPDDTTLKAVWTAVDVQDTEPNFTIDEVSITSSDGKIPFILTNDGLWPTGKYKVDVYLNDELKQTLNFEVP